MAAFGVMAALHERRRSGEGQYVDVSMADGALSWLAMVAGRYFCDGEVPRRGEQQLAGGLACYMPYEAADGWVTCGALEPKFWAAFCNGVERPDLIETPVRPARLRGLARGGRGLPRRTREEWKAFNDEHDCCIEPVLDLDEALDSELVRAREMVVEMDQPRFGPVRQLGVPVKLSRTPGDPTRPAPAFGEHTDEVLREAGYSDEEIAAMKRVRRRRRPRRRRRDHLPGMSGGQRRPAAHGRAGRGLRRAGADDQALPARGPAAGAGQDQPQHGLLPARVRRPDQADQAAAGGALHAAEGDQVGARRRPRARPRPGRARGPDPRPGAGRRAHPDQRRRGPRALRRPQGGARPARGARGAEPQQPRLLALRREDHRGDQPLPRRRLRRGDRLHRLRHPALQERPRRAGQARRSRW